LLQKTFGAGAADLLQASETRYRRIPEYSQQLVTLIGPRELGTGFLWATLVGFTWLLAQSAVALTTNRPRLSPWVLGWILATLIWIPAMVTPWRDLASLHQTDPWIAVAAAALLVAVGTVEAVPAQRSTERLGTGVTRLVVAAVLAERLVIAVTPKVSAAALSFRELMPIVPLYALVAGGGIWSAAGAVALLIPSTRPARAAVAVLTAAVLVTFWSPFLRERLSSQPLLGRVADRGADTTKAEGLRVEALLAPRPGWRPSFAAQRPDSHGHPAPARLVRGHEHRRQDNLINLNSQVRNEEEKRQYILDRAGPRGVMVRDRLQTSTGPIRVATMHASGARRTRPWPAGRIWRRRSSRATNFNNPVFYVIRNHGYAAAARQKLAAVFGHCPLGRAETILEIRALGFEAQRLLKERLGFAEGARAHRGFGLGGQRAGAIVVQDGEGALRVLWMTASSGGRCQLA